MTRLAGGTGLRSLWSPQAAVTDDEMAIIGSLTDLEFLQLDGSNVTDKGFAHVANLKKLTLLDMSLTGTNLTDSSVETLAGLKSLKKLNINRSRISPAGIERLKQALPKTNMSTARRPD